MIRYPPGWIVTPSGPQTTTIWNGTSIVFVGPSLIRLVNRGPSKPPSFFDAFVPELLVAPASEPKTRPEAPAGGGEPLELELELPLALALSPRSAPG